MKKENAQPLYQILNANRTQGEFVSFKNPLSKNGQYIVKSIPSEIYVHYVSSEETLDDNETKANSDYTALAVNNLANVADALQGLVKFYDNENEPSERAKDLINKAKEALKAIS